MCKRILTIIAVVVALSGLVMADNVVDVEQTAATDNQVLIDQGGSGNEVVIKQVASTGSNFAGGSIDFGDSFLDQTGSNNKVDVDQAGTDQQIEIDQFGSGNKIVGAVWNSGSINYAAAARQLAGGYNYLRVVTYGNDNIVGLNQEASGFNEVLIYQDGTGNVIGMSSNARAGDNMIGGWGAAGPIYGIIQVGGDNLVWLNQDAGTDNTVIKADQRGNGNKLVGAAYCGDIDEGTAAYQYSAYSYNYLDLEQLGGGNTLGLRQYNADGSNSANVSQLGGGNSAGVYQYANTALPMGNTLWIDQSGGDIANVCQIANAGFNNADIDQ